MDKSHNQRIKDVEDRIDRNLTTSTEFIHSARTELKTLATLLDHEDLAEDLPSLSNASRSAKLISSLLDHAKEATSQSVADENILHTLLSERAGSNSIRPNLPKRIIRRKRSGEFFTKDLLKHSAEKTRSEVDRWVQTTLEKEPNLSFGKLMKGAATTFNMTDAFQGYRRGLPNKHPLWGWVKGSVDGTTYDAGLTNKDILQDWVTSNFSANDDMTMVVRETAKQFGFPPSVLKAGPSANFHPIWNWVEEALLGYPDA